MTARIIERRHRCGCGRWLRDGRLRQVRMREASLFVDAGRACDGRVGEQLLAPEQVQEAAQVAGSARGTAVSGSSTPS